MIYTASQTANYRAITPKATAKMQNVCFHTFMCRKCNQVRPVAGRKSLGHKAGYKCKECSQ